MKLVTLAVFGAGYVLGTKAGRQRYEQLATGVRLAARRLDAYSNNVNGGRTDATEGRRTGEDETSQT